MRGFRRSDLLLHVLFCGAPTALFDHRDDFADLHLRAFRDSRLQNAIFLGRDFG